MEKPIYIKIQNTEPIQIVPPCFSGSVISLSISSRETGNGFLMLCDGVPGQFYNTIEVLEGLESKNVDVDLESDGYFNTGLFVIPDSNVLSFEIEVEFK